MCKTGGTQLRLGAACFVVQSCLADADCVVFSNYCLIGTRQTTRQDFFFLFAWGGTGYIGCREFWFDALCGEDTVPAAACERFAPQEGQNLAFPASVPQFGQNIVCYLSFLYIIRARREPTQTDKKAQQFSAIINNLRMSIKNYRWI